MFLQFLLIFCLIGFANGQIDGIPTPPSPPLDIAMGKCFWMVFGEFNYNQAKSACAIRNGTMATFNSPSEDHIIRHRIDWDLVPGYLEGTDWVGQVWLGARRVAGDNGNEWQWDTPIKQNVPFSFATWIGDSTGGADDQCAVAQEAGWKPAKCDAIVGGSKKPAGALCETITRASPDSDILASSTNYCDIVILSTLKL